MAVAGDGTSTNQFPTRNSVLVLLRWHRVRGPMARRAVLGSRLVEENCLSRDHTGRLVTRGAAHVLMSAPQGESRPLLVVKQRRFPLRAVVTLGTTRYVGYSELLRVDVLMAVLTRGRSRFEIDIDQLGLEIRRLVTVFAGRRPMSSQEREFCLRMIEG